MFEETKCSNENLDTLALALQCQKGYISIAPDATGHVGGLIVLWNHVVVEFTKQIANLCILVGILRLHGSKGYGCIFSIYRSHIPMKKVMFHNSLSQSESNFSNKSAWWKFQYDQSLDEKNEGIRHMNTNSHLLKKAIRAMHIINIHITIGTFT